MSRRQLQAIRTATCRRCGALLRASSKARLEAKYDAHVKDEHDVPIEGRRYV